MTDEMVEDAAKAWFFCMHSIMHDHEEEWRKFDKAWLYRECARAALATRPAPDREAVIEEVCDIILNRWPYTLDGPRSNREAFTEHLRKFFAASPAQKGDKMREALACAGVNLTTAAIVIEKLGHEMEAQPFRKAADQVAAALSEAQGRE